MLKMSVPQMAHSLACHGWSSLQPSPAQAPASLASAPPATSPAAATTAAAAPQAAPTPSRQLRLGPDQLWERCGHRGCGWHRIWGQQQRDVWLNCYGVQAKGARRLRVPACTVERTASRATSAVVCSV